MGHQASLLEFREVNRDVLGDFVELFESRGGPKSCWCMAWRATPEEARKTDGASRKVALIGRVQQDVPVGILGYIDGKPVTWCSIAPRSTYRRLGGPVEDARENVWSLVCFFVRREHRGRGMTARLIRAAVEPRAGAGRRSWRRTRWTSIPRVTDSWGSCRCSSRECSDRRQ